jgi:hypothetical protein
MDSNIKKETFREFAEQENLSEIRDYSYHSIFELGSPGISGLTDGTVQVRPAEAEQRVNTSTHSGVTPEFV